MRQYTDIQTILNAKAATGVGNYIDVADWRHLVIQLATANSANLTVKCQGSIEDTSPDFSAAQSATNMWDYIEMIDMQSGSAIDGDTGISPAGTDDFRLFEVNTNGLKWLSFRVTARSAGSVTVKVKPFNN